MFKFSCPYHLKGCSKQFRSQSGCTYHVRSAHGDNHNILQNPSDNEPNNEALHNNDDHWHELPGEDNIVPAENDNGPPSTPASPTQAGNVYHPTPQRNIHPHINGNFY